MSLSQLCPEVFVVIASYVTESTLSGGSCHHSVLGHRVNFVWGGVVIIASLCF